MLLAGPVRMVTTTTATTPSMTTTTTRRVTSASCQNVFCLGLLWNDHGFVSDSIAEIKLSQSFQNELLPTPVGEAIRDEKASHHRKLQLSQDRLQSPNASCVLSLYIHHSGKDADLYTTMGTVSLRQTLTAESLTYIREQLCKHTDWWPRTMRFRV